MKVANLRLGLECNHDCLFCTIADDNDETLSTKEAKEKIDLLIEQGVDTINFTGGEPTIRDDLVDLIAYAKKKGIKHIELQTNGVALADKVYLKSILNAGVDRNLLIAFHSHKKNVYNTLTNSNNFEKAKKGLFNTMKKHKVTAISHVINELNYKDLLNFSRFVHETGYKPIIYFSLLRPNGNTKDNKNIIPYLKKIEPHLKQSLDFLNQKGFCVEVEGVPLCYMSGYDKISAETRRIKKVGAYKETQIYANDKTMYDAHKKVRDTLKIKSKRCRSCQKDKICAGIWKEYAQVRGLSELRPFIQENKKTLPVLGIGNICNNSCIMCTSVMPLPKNHKEPNTDYIFKKIESFPKNFESITITGGEPTIKRDFFRILNKIKTELPNTKIKIISNGRMFSNENFMDILTNFKNIEIITELHSHDKKTHDKITRVNGSFDETYKGIKNIIKRKIPVEFRMVISKLNYKDMPKLGSLFSKEFPEAERIVMFPIDLIGNANKNKKKTFVTYSKIKDYMQKTIDNLCFKDIRIFHTPFCILDKKYWKYIKGVTVLDRRVELADNCKDCVFKNRCPKVWRTYVKNHGINEFKPIKKRKD